MSKVPSPIDQPAPMEGGGAYNAKSSVQANGLLPAIDWLEDAAKSIPIDDEHRDLCPIVIADYGSSAGRNSMLPMAAAICALRDRLGDSRPISVVHTDLPGNDFSALFSLLDNDPQSYLATDSAVYAYAVGRSFFGPVLPPQSVTLGWSSWAVQWLSRIPAPIPDHVQAAFSRDAQTRATYAVQAESDWRRFLVERSRELRKDGRCIIVTMASDDEGRFGYDALMASMLAGLHRMCDEGLLTPEAFARMTIPTVGRTRSEFAKPFGHTGEDFENLRLEKLEIFFAEDRIWTEYERSRDAKAYGASWAAFSRASVFPTLALALQASQGDERVSQFMDRLESETASGLAAEPQPMNMPLALIALRRL